MNLKELKSKETFAKLGVAVASVLLLALTSSAFFMMKREEWNIFALMPITSIPILITSIKRLKKIQKEIQLRNS